MSNCSSNCPTQDHQTYGQCLRAKSLKIGYCASTKGFDATREKRHEAELQAYRDARAQGVQPAGTTRPQIEQALALSDTVGKAYDATTSTFTDTGV